jgi:hydrogenase maturation protease
MVLLSMENLNKQSSKPVLDSEQVLKKIPKTLIIGYGNPDREDDGVAWHVLQGVAEYFKIPISSDTDIGVFPEGNSLDFWFNLQLMPEMAPEMLGYERICFVDAHTGAIEAEIHAAKIKPVFQSSPLTHHMTAETIVAILENLYHHSPDTLFISIRGYQFRFLRALSERTQELSEKAVKVIADWVNDYPEKPS